MCNAASVLVHVERVSRREAVVMTCYGLIRPLRRNLRFKAEVGTTCPPRTWQAHSVGRVSTSACEVLVVSATRWTPRLCDPRSAWPMWAQAQGFEHVASLQSASVEVWAATNRCPAWRWLAPGAAGMTFADLQTIRALGPGGVTSRRRRLWCLKAAPEDSPNRVLSCSFCWSDISLASVLPLSSP